MTNNFPDLVSAAYEAARTAVIGQLGQQSFRRRVVTMAIVGPANSTLTIYRGRIISPLYLVSTVYPAGARFYDSTAQGAPIQILPNESYLFVWTGGATGVGQTATASLQSEVS